MQLLKLPGVGLQLQPFLFWQLDAWLPWDGILLLFQ
jgi:hypothetical protein